MKSVLPAILILLLPLACFSQTRVIDSLKKKIAADAVPEKKLMDIFALCDQSASLNPDTMRDYLTFAATLAPANKTREQILLKYYGIINLMVKGEIGAALNKADDCLELLHSSNENNLLLEAKVQQQKGKCYIRKNQYSPAIQAGYAAMAIGEKANDAATQVKARILIGWAYMEMGQMKEALQWHLAALHESADSNIYNQNPVLYANLCTNYTALNNLDSAFYFAGKAITTARRMENLFTLANALAMHSELSEKTGDLPAAENDLKEVVTIRKVIGDPFYIAADMSQLGYFYAHNGQPQKGLDICNEGIAIAKKYRLDSKLFFLYSSLAENYRAAGNMKDYAGVLEKIIAMKDSVYSVNSANALADIQSNYELQKKENLIIRQQLGIRQRNYLFFGTLILLLFAAVLAAVLFRGYRRKQNFNMLQMQEEEKIRSAIAITKAEESERKRIAADLHDNLGAYGAAVASNVDRLSLGHESEAAMKELKLNSQSIVSQLNDTIWVLKKDNLSLTAISDRIKVFIQQISASYPQLGIDVIEHIHTDILLPPARAFNLYQVIKEGISNAVKHSGAAALRIFFESGETWKITIADNGRGISESEKNMSKGNGLINMRYRSKEAGFDIQWKDNKTAGTKVIIVPTTN